MRRIFYLSLTLFLLIFLNTHSQTDRWKSIYSDYNSKIYLDTDSIIFENNTYNVWLKSYLNDGCCVQTFHQKYYCGKRKLDNLQSFIVNENNEKLTLEPSYYMDILPESFQEVVYKYLCVKQ